MNKHLITYLLILGCYLSTWGQSISPRVIASAGTYVSSPSVSLSYTVGEMSAIQTYTGTGNILTQGFHQPWQIVSGIMDAEKGNDGSFSVYPNPAPDNFYYGYEFAGKGKVSVKLYNEAGQVTNYHRESDYYDGKVIEEIDGRLYAAGNYILRLEFMPEGKSNPVLLSRKIQLTHP